MLASSGRAAPVACPDAPAPRDGGCRRVAAPPPAAAARRARRVALAATGGQPSFDEGRAASNYASSFERRSEKERASSAETCEVVQVEDIPLTSECGADYTLLRDLLAGCEWEKADDETRLKLCQLAGEEAETREWVYYSEVKDIPAADLATIDALWRGYSNGRFGFSVQRAIWLAEKRKWGQLFTRIGWTMGENKAYRKFPSEFLWAADAPKGHLPLTNCLRGTQLFSELLQHPAFGGALEPTGVRAQGNGQTSIGGFTRGGPPPLEKLSAQQRAGLVAMALGIVLLGVLNSNSSPDF